MNLHHAVDFLSGPSFSILGRLALYFTILSFTWTVQSKAILAVSTQAALVRSLITTYKQQLHENNAFINYAECCEKLTRESFG